MRIRTIALIFVVLGLLSVLVSCNRAQGGGVNVVGAQRALVSKWSMFNEDAVLDDAIIYTNIMADIEPSSNNDWANFMRLSETLQSIRLNGSADANFANYILFLEDLGILPYTEEGTLYPDVSKVFTFPYTVSESTGVDFTAFLLALSEPMELEYTYKRYVANAELVYVLVDVIFYEGISGQVLLVVRANEGSEVTVESVSHRLILGNPAWETALARYVEVRDYTHVVDDTVVE